MSRIKAIVLTVLIVFVGVPIFLLFITIVASNKFICGGFLLILLCILVYSFVTNEGRRIKSNKEKEL